MEEDWLMRQFKVVGVGIGKVLKKELSAVELGEVQVSDGTMVSREVLLKAHLEAEEYQEAFLLVHSLKLKMSLFEFNTVSDWFIDYLKKAVRNGRTTVTAEQITTYQEKLKALY